MPRDVALSHIERDQKLPAGGEMTSEVSTPNEGHGTTGARAAYAAGSVVIFHGRVEPVNSDINDGPPLGAYHATTGPLPKDQ